MRCSCAYDMIEIMHKRLIVNALLILVFLSFANILILIKKSIVFGK